MPNAANHAMNTSAILVLSTLVATCTAVGVGFLLRPPEALANPTPAADVQKELADLRTLCQGLQRQLETIAQAPAPAVSTSGTSDRTAAPVLNPEQVAAAVEAYLQKRGGAGAAEAAVAATASFDLQTEFGKLQGTNFFEDPTLWKRLLAAGKMDEAIKQFEALAKANPNDTKAQMELANAYLAYVNMDPTKYQYSIDADKVFDNVLQLDEKHWEARFTKAMSYTFWPDFLGKKKDAIAHFETLVNQQESMPVQEHEAQTYLFLGNLLETRDPAKAKEMWARGARRHPDNQELVNKAK